MTDLAEVAASVAQALGMRLVENGAFAKRYVEDIKHPLRGPDILRDGSNLTDPYWRCRCLDWLLEQGTSVCFHRKGLIHSVSGFLIGDMDGDPNCKWIKCPAAEFPARAIHAIVTREEGR